MKGRTQGQQSRHGDINNAPLIDPTIDQCIHMADDRIKTQRIQRIQMILTKINKEYWWCNIYLTITEIMPAISNKQVTCNSWNLIASYFTFIISFTFFHLLNNSNNIKTQSITRVKQHTQQMCICLSINLSIHNIAITNIPIFLLST